MRLLVTTQAVDLDDPVLGFFHRWLLEFSKQCESVHVICLKEGRHELPPNVFVHSLGKESGRSRIKYITRFYRYIRMYRSEYDAVFVHMNPEYVLLGGALWRLWGKHIGLWYVHKKVSWRLRAALFFANAAYTVSRTTFNIQSNKVHVLGHGIDTNFFAPMPELPTHGSILSLGRIDPVKHVDVFVRALEQLHEENVSFSCDIVGSPTEAKSKYAHDVRNQASTLALDGVLAMRSAVSNDTARELFRSHEIFCNMTPTGSFDKTILEAMASGCICVVSNRSFGSILTSALVAEDVSERAVASGLRAALGLTQKEREELRARSRAYVIKEHSLDTLVTNIVSLLS